MGYSLWGHKESDTTEGLSTQQSTGYRKEAGAGRPEQGGRETRESDKRSVLAAGPKARRMTEVELEPICLGPKAATSPWDELPKDSEIS